MDLAGCVTSIRPFFDICLFFSHSVSLLFPPLSSFLSPHYHCQISLIMKYCYCMTAKMGHGGGQGSETANHNNKKKKNRGSGFSIKAYTVELPPPLSLLSSPLPALCVVCVCVCVSEQEHFFQCVGGVISLSYAAPLTSLFKG